MTQIIKNVLLACLLLLVSYMFYKVCFSTSTPRNISDISSNRLIVYIQADSLKQRLDTFSCDWMEVSGIHFWSNDVSFKPMEGNKEKFLNIVNPDNLAILVAKDIEGIKWDEKQSTLTLPIVDDYVTMPVYLLNALAEQGALIP